MAEFCLDCYNELHGTHYTEQEVELEEDLCEGCGQIKPVVVAFRSQWSLPGARVLHWVRVRLLLLVEFLRR